MFTKLKQKQLPRWTYHVGFWVCYTLFWHFLFAPSPFSVWSLMVSMIYSSCHALGAYFNIYLLLPKLLNHKRYLSYGFSLLLAIACSSVLLMVSLQAFFEWASPGYDYWSSMDRINLLGSTVGSTFSGIMMVMGIKMVRQRLQQEKSTRRQEKKQLQEEIKFLKSQMNPHFLFNAINSIYFLIKKNPDAAAEALAQFSDMLRYQLYECSTKVISIQQEIHFLQNYISLAQLRKGDQLKVKVSYPTELDHLQITPLMLIPFIENAFKHVSNFHDQPNWIDIDMRISPQQEMILSITNTIDHHPNPAQNSHRGIGLKNVKRRLDLTYPNQYTLDISNDQQVFKVLLKLPIHYANVELSYH